MAKKKNAGSETEEETTTSDTMTAETAGSNPASPGAGDKNVSAYFKDLLRGRKDLLRQRSNEEIFAIWLADHTAYTVVPKNVQQGLSNVKSTLRKEMGIDIKGGKGSKGKSKKPKTPRTTAIDNGMPAPAVIVLKTMTPTRGLEALEILLDDALLMARKIEGVDLEAAMRQLRQARIQIGLKLGLL